MSPAPARESQWRWPREPELLQSVEERAIARAEFRALGLPEGVVDNPALRRAAIDDPDDDAPRQAYAAWLSAQDHEFAQLLGSFIAAQLRVAQTFRASRGADVGALRSWRGDTAYISTAEFRLGDVLRPWFLDDLSPLLSLGLVGWPQIYRGFVERVAVRAARFLEICKELFEIAPIRHLVIIGVPEVVDELAACPHLARIRSISLPKYRREDDLTDEVLRRLVASPHLGNLAHLRLVHQHRLSPHAYEHAVTAPTLPRLSSFEVLTHQVGWHSVGPSIYDRRRRSERMVDSDTPIPVIRSRDWIAASERRIGHVPCLHPEHYYSRDRVDLEAVVERPIALDDQIIARRGLAMRSLPQVYARPR